MDNALIHPEAANLPRQVTRGLSYQWLQLYSLVLIHNDIQIFAFRFQTLRCTADCHPPGIVTGEQEQLTISTWPCMPLDRYGKRDTNNAIPMSHQLAIWYLNLPQGAHLRTDANGSTTICIHRNQRCIMSYVIDSCRQAGSWSYEILTCLSS